MVKTIGNYEKLGWEKNFGLEVGLCVAQILAQTPKFKLPRDPFCFKEESRNQSREQQWEEGSWQRREHIVQVEERQATVIEHHAR